MRAGSWSRIAASAVETAHRDHRLRADRGPTGGAGKRSCVLEPHARPSLPATDAAEYTTRLPSGYPGALVLNEDRQRAEFDARFNHHSGPARSPGERVEHQVGENLRSVGRKGDVQTRAATRDDERYTRALRFDRERLDHIIDHVVERVLAVVDNRWCTDGAARQVACGTRAPFDDSEGSIDLLGHPPPERASATQPRSTVRAFDTS